MTQSRCHMRMGVSCGGCGGKRAARQPNLPGWWQCTLFCCAVAGAWQGRHAWASAAWFLPHNSAATNSLSVWFASRWIRCTGRWALRWVGVSWVPPKI
eukprot:1153862-Pelagomonas_calceolata.AAC.4